MKIEVDEARCIGSGNCVLTAPDLFDQRDEDGIAVVLDRNPAAARHDDAHHAAELCPVDAVIVRA